MKKILYTLAAASAAVLLASCTKFLETTPTDRVSDALAWSSEEYADMYINNFYAFIDRYGQFGSNQFSGNLTEGLTPILKYASPTPGTHAGDANNYVFYPERITVSSNLLDIWPTTYERIRRVNEFLANLPVYSHYSPEVNLRYEAQARFFRAFLYFQLARRYGGVVLYDNLDFSIDKARATEAETWDLVARDLDFAAQNLPRRWDSANEGRVTRYAAFALKSRAMLYAERWEDAKVAADSVILNGGYALTPKYEDAFAGGNSESILEFRYDPAQKLSHAHDRYHVPYGDMLAIGIDESGGCAGPTQEFVEEYEDKNGNKVDWSAWHTGNPEATRPPYENLEPRFAATVLYNGCTWKDNVMDITETGNHGRYMAYKADSYAKGRTVTGYYLRKFLDEDTDFQYIYTNGSGTTWVDIRLAEVLLNRAEAKYRLNGGGMDDVNTVRARVGLPEKSASGTAVFDAIRHERLVELAFEGHLWWDMRRWRLADKEWNGIRVHGMKVDGTPGSYTYQYVDADLQDRKFLTRLYTLPIPTSETDKNRLIEQYDEWK